MSGSHSLFGNRIRQVSTAAPWRWLAAGWNDVRAMRARSLLYSLPFVLFGYVSTAGLYLAGWHYLIWPALTGFFLLAPAFAVGFYEASRRMEAGEDITFKDMLFAWKRNPSRIFGAGLTLCFFMILWLRSASLIYAINFPHQMLSLQGIMNQTFFSLDGVSFFAVGTVIGAAFAIAAFLFSVLSLPMILGEKADLLPSIFMSVGAVAANPRAMALWAAIIVAGSAAGIATLFLGLILTMPLLGHASWHAYRSVIEPEAPSRQHSAVLFQSSEVGSGRNAARHQS
jgi:uncharacterized membrane protein